MGAPEFLIDDAIGGDGWFSSGITAKSLNRFLKDNAKADEILVRVNSPGGDVFEGVALSVALKEFKGRVVAEVEGYACSAASYVIMSADEIRVHKGAMIMIHEAAGVTWGRASDHESNAELLTKINSEMADLYAARTGQDVAGLLEMMKKTTWMNAEEAKALGFCDSIIPAKGKTAAKPKSKAAAQLYAGYAQSAPAKFQSALATMLGLPDPHADDEPPALPTTHKPLTTAARSHLGELAPRARTAR